jgi:hypothetical protein
MTLTCWSRSSEAALCLARKLFVGGLREHWGGFLMPRHPQALGGGRSNLGGPWPGLEARNDVGKLQEAFPRLQEVS